MLALSVLCWLMDSPAPDTCAFFRVDPPAGRSAYKAARSEVAGEVTETRSCHQRTGTVRGLGQACAGLGDTEPGYAVGDTTASSRARSIIGNHLLLSVLLGFVPLPLFDAVAQVNIQFSLLSSLAACHGRELVLRDRITLIVVLAGVLPVLVLVVSSGLLGLIAGFGSLTAGAVLGTLGGAVCLITGRVLQRRFQAMAASGAPRTRAEHEWERDC